MFKMEKKIISKICLYLVISLMFIVPINISYADDDGSILGGSDKTIDDVSSTCSLAPPVDVKSSLILSIVMMCLPGILEKTMEWKEIKCDKVVCSYEAVKNNLDPTFCKKEAAYKTCDYIMGEVFALPPMAILDYLRDLIAGLLANPIGMAYGIAVKLARESVSNACTWDSGAGSTTGVCDSRTVGPQAIILAVNDILAMVQTFKEMMENGFNFFESEESSCEQMSEIREELEGLV